MKFLITILFSLLLISNLGLVLGQEIMIDDKIQKLENDISILKERLSEKEDKTIDLWIMIGGLITGIATSILVGALWYQTRLLKKSSQLESGPKIFPRYIHNAATNKINIYVYNVGKSSAIDIHLEFFDEHYTKIGQDIDRYSLTEITVKTYDPIINNWRPELIDPQISFPNVLFKFRIRGSYRDANNDKILIDELYAYPPKILD